jgi:transcriptional regulator with XRE-family HTH domain
MPHSIDQDTKSPDMQKNHSFILRHELKRLLLDKGISASDLARKTGISKQVISDWLAGVMPRNLMQLKQVASFFDVPVDHLCFGEHHHPPAAAKKPQWITGKFEGKIRVLVE